MPIAYRSASAVALVNTQRAIEAARTGSSVPTAPCGTRIALQTAISGVDLEPDAASFGWDAKQSKRQNREKSQITC